MSIWDGPTKSKVRLGKEHIGRRNFGEKSPYVTGGEFTTRKAGEEKRECRETERENHADFWRDIWRAREGGFQRKGSKTTGAWGKGETSQTGGSTSQKADHLGKRVTLSVKN